MHLEYGKELQYHTLDEKFRHCVYVSLRLSPQTHRCQLFVGSRGTFGLWRVYACPGAPLLVDDYVSESRRG